jgi:alpha-N-arabinofuranosidase
MHFYTDFRNSKEKVSTFEPRGWYDVIREGLRTENVIERHWEAMGKYDPNRRTKLIVDEWGVWYAPGEETAPAHLLSQPLTLRDALHTAVTFDVFNRHADKVAMANVAQTINCIHSLFLAQGDRFTRTPVYYVFEMYKNHMGAKSVPLRARCDELTVPASGGTARMPGISGSASFQNGALAVSLTNPSHDSPLTARIRLVGGTAAEARGVVLTHSEMTARNTFDRPDEVKPAPLPVTLRGGVVEVAMPKHAVASIEVRVS